MNTFDRFGWGFLALVAALLLHQSFLPGNVLFSNDLPLGLVSAHFYDDLSSVLGMWLDLNWSGFQIAAAPLSSHTLLVFLLGPVGYAKFAGMFATIFLGWSGWFYFRRVGCDPLVSLLGGLALMLNMVFLGFTAWGVFAWNLGLGFAIITFAILHKERYTWKDIVKAGFFIGMCVNDGTDVGAILAVLIGIYFIVRNFPRIVSDVRKLEWPVWQLIAIVGLAVFIASNRLASIQSTYVEGVKTEVTNEQSKQELWNFLTQWSLPKKEVAGMIIPGLFGYRMDTPDGGQYWGEVGRSPSWTPQAGPNGARFSGGGLYVGKGVLVIALLGALAAFVPRLKAAPTISVERREVLFWSVVCLVCFTFILGKFFVTYQLVYSLPFFSSIRNPVKFIVPFMLGLVILFGHGMRLLTAKNNPDQQKLLLKLFLGIAGGFLVFHVGLLAFWAGGRDTVLGYLANNAFDAATRQAIYRFSQKEILISFLLLLATGALLILCLRAKQKTGPLIALAVLLVVDLGWADQHWIKYFNYQQRYQSNPVIEVLRKNPHEQRVAGPKYGSGPYFLSQDVPWFSSLYDVEWLQHHFQYYNIQSPDIIQWPRMPIMDSKVARAFGAKANPDGRTLDVIATLRASLRWWELSNTRYVLTSLAGYQGLRGIMTNHQFGLVKSFTVVPNGEYYTAIETTNGPLALIEFSNALPRAKFYSNWRTEPDEDKALALVAGEQFDPAREVVVVTNEVPGIKPGEAGAAAETKITEYGPKKYVISLTNSAPGVLLLNSRYDPNWRVTVDGQPRTLLRCNFLMSGVAVSTPGQHEVVFRYAPDPTLFYVNAASVVILLLLLVVPFPKRKEPLPATPKAVPQSKR